MGSGLLTGLILVILTTCYTNGLSLTDLYPYGTEHGDTVMTDSNLNTASLLAPINNLVRFGPLGLTGRRYEVRDQGNLEIRNEGDDSIFLHVVFSTGDFFNTKVHGRTTNDSVLINRAMDQINEAFPNTFCRASPPTQLVIATWIDYLKTNTQQGSNFQIVIVTNGHITFGIALYVDVHVTPAIATGVSSTINGNTVPADPSLFPFGTNTTNAPSMMLNSNIPGAYIFSLNDTPPDPHSSVCCKARLIELACEAMRINGGDVPASCNN